MKPDEKVSFIPEFISLFGKAWSDPDRQFNEDDEIFYKENLISFCNESVVDPFPATDYFKIFDFLTTSVTNFLQLLTSESKISDYLLEGTSNIMILLEHLAINCNSRPTQSYFEKQLTTLIKFVISLDENKLDLVLKYYEDTRIFDRLCFYIQTLSDFILPDEITDSFMRKLRRNEKEFYFQFLLFPLNNVFFRNNLKLYPDECDSKELYYAIKSRYFTITSKNDVHNLLIRMCEQTSDEDINKKSLSNPVYVYWRLIQENYSVSISDLYPFIDRLFNH